MSYRGCHRGCHIEVVIDLEIEVVIKVVIYQPIHIPTHIPTHEPTHSVDESYQLDLIINATYTVLVKDELGLQLRNLRIVSTHNAHKPAPPTAIALPKTQLDVLQRRFSGDRLCPQLAQRRDVVLVLGRVLRKDVADVEYQGLVEAHGVRPFRLQLEHDR